MFRGSCRWKSDISLAEESVLERRQPKRQNVKTA